MIGDRLKNIREHLKFSQKQFAELLKFSSQSLCHYENGKRELPNELFKQIVYSYNVNANWLLTGKGSMFLNTVESGECMNCQKLNEVIGDLRHEIKGMEISLATLEKVLVTVVQNSKPEKEYPAKKNTG